MVRIKGENSDYRFDVTTGGVLEVQPQPEQVYMKLFICPNDQPSLIDKRKSDAACCEGVSQHCPGNSKAGHAMIRLHQTEGISLVTDRDNRIILDQQGKIQLSPATQVELTGHLVLKQPGQAAELTLKATEQGFELEMSTGAKICFDRSGNLELRPLDGKAVSISSNLRVEGEIEIKGNLTVGGTINGQLSDSLLNQLDQRFQAKPK